MDNSIVISTPPHVKSRRTTRKIMLDVLIALLPCAIMGCVFFGWQALVIELISVAICFLSEFCYFFIANKGFAKKCKDAKAVVRRFFKQFDLTSIVTGLILALVIPVTASEWWRVTYEVAIGAIFSIIIVKMVFGGTGKNLVNPAAAGRVFIFLSFSISSFTACLIGAIDGGSVDPSSVSSGATNLAGVLASGDFSSPTILLKPLDLLLGTGVSGCIGETCKIAIIVGYIYLCVRKVIKWWQPLLFIAVFGFCAVLLSGFAYDTYTFNIELFLPHILSGGVMFAAVFMFTDYVTSPKGVIGQLVYYIVGALLTALLRAYKGVEVVSFVILIMNLITPLIDRYCVRKPFGYKKEKKQKEGK